MIKIDLYDVGAGEEGRGFQGIGEKYVDAIPLQGSSLEIGDIEYIVDGVTIRVYDTNLNDLTPHIAAIVYVSCGQMWGERND